MAQDVINDFLLKTLHYARFELEYARAGSDAWLGHVAFGYMLVSEFRPNLLVELGTHWGNSYFSFCQAVRDQQLNTKCFAVDSWEGDPQAGFYDDTIFDAVSEQNAQYESFSTLKRMLFDDAVSSFDDGSIDLLHIDGFHSYETVKHDFGPAASSFSMTPMNTKKVLASAGFGMSSVNRVRNTTCFGTHMDLAYGENQVEKLWNLPYLDIC